MAQNLPRSVYWRRRALVLGLAIGILALLAWTVNGMADRGGQASQAGRITRVPGQAGRHRQAADGPSARSADSPAAPPAAQTQARPVPAPTPASAPAGLPAACRPSQVVLSLVPGQGSYGPHEHPQFSVYVVSIGKRDCSFNVGPGYLSVVIKSGGISRIWSSADCAKGMGSDFVPLSTGVPSVLHFSWDRKASSPGCRTAPVAVRPGTYTATVTAPGDHLASQGMVFILNGPGVAVP